ncbi:sulfurtransferase complex subunit TusD [Utexia brackfieldae]|uniref:sulfurtransferase complex subunit TusD n=1 Tax=Utexia brackfieldae TaxID=3074108 RepID=UPI00370D5624
MSHCFSLNYTIIIMGPIYGTQQAYLAYQFAEALLKTSHHLKHIFFYAEGVYNANQYSAPANDEFNLREAWGTLASQYDISLDVCVSAGLRRGIIREDELNTIDSHFNASGLTSLAEAIANSDRVIQF